VTQERDALLEAWLDEQLPRASAAMLRSVSPLDLSKTRTGFGHTIHPRRGSIIASPVLADWNPEPDYFFHWFRDSAVVIDALRLLFRARRLGRQALEHFADFVRFSLDLRSLDGRRLVADGSWRARALPDFVRFLRTDAELEAAHGAAVLSETRVNPDGTLDISSWSRPQHDGAPLRALAVLRWANEVALPTELSRDVSELVRGDLAFTAAFWRQPSFDIWEEELGLHYYTLSVSAAALAAGAAWLHSAGEDQLAAEYQEQSRTIRSRLDDYWLPEAGHYASRVLASGARSSKELDIAIILAAVHAPERGIRHSVSDPRMVATFERLVTLFDGLYEINRNRPAERGAAMGRYAGDVYFSGGAYYFSTLGAAEFCFLAAAAESDGSAWISRGDAFLECVRYFVPADGEMSEQFDQRTGAPSSAHHLAWSYAAFISTVMARNAVMGAAGTRRRAAR
jgi:glucoamylase